MMQVPHILVDLTQYGRRLRAMPQLVVPGVMQEREYVLVSGEYVLPGYSQQMLVRAVWREEGGRAPVVERNYGYVEVNGVLHISSVEQRIRRNGVLMQDALRRTHDVSGAVLSESHVVDGAVARLRRFYREEHGDLIHEERYEPDGTVCARQTFTQHDAGGWKTFATRIVDGEEQVSGREVAMDVPVLEGRTCQITWLEPLTLALD